MDKIKKFVDDKIQNIENSATINDGDITTIYRLLDIKKNIKEIDKKEEEPMNYFEGYGRRGRGRERDSRGRYTERDTMSARGGRGSYGHYPEEMLDRMMEGYEGYMEGMEEYNRMGNYSAKDKGIEALEYMLNGFVNFFESLQESMESPEEVELIKKYARKIKEM